MRLRTYCLACREDTGSIDSKINQDKSRFMKQKRSKKVVSRYYKTNMLT